MIDLLEKELRDRWAELLPGRRTPARVRTAILASSREPAGTRIVLVFAEGASSPAMVAKVPRQPWAVAPLEREWRLLELIGRDMPVAMKHTIPSPLIRTSIQGVPVYVQTALPGKNLKTLLQRGHRVALARQVGQDLERMDVWLNAFQSIRPPEVDPEGLPLPRDGGLGKAVGPAMPHLIEASILSRSQARELEAVAERLDQAQAGKAACWVHGDLWPGNVLIEGGTWHILDWDGVSVGPGWEDRFWFALHYGMLAQVQLMGKDDMEEGLRRTLFEDDPVSGVVRGYLEEIVRREGQDGLTAASWLSLLLAREAGRALMSEGRLRAFDRMAPGVLKAWMAAPEPSRRSLS